MAAFVQSKSAFSTSAVASIGVAFDSSVTAGNAIFAGGNEASDAFGAFTDGTNSYTTDETSTQGIYSAGIGSALDIASGATTVTYTCDDTVFASIAIFEFSGIATSAAEDVSASTNQPWGATIAIGSTGTTEADVCIAWCPVSFGCGGWVSHPDGYTAQEVFESSGNNAGSFCYKIQSSSGNEAPDWGWTDDKSLAANFVAYKQSAEAGSDWTTHEHITLSFS